jgi:hypothetical protein
VKEKVVSLVLPEADAVQGSAGVEVDVQTDAPQVDVRLRLWNREGREPREAVRRHGTTRWQLPDPQEGFAGCSLTWVVRMASPEPTHFQLSLQVLQRDTALPDANFLYSGPLEGLEERSGRFHFAAGPPKTSV